MRAAYRALFNLACSIGRPFGGIRPRRVYDALGRRAFTQPEFSWQRNRWGHELCLSPHYQIDRTIIALGCHDENVNLAIERLIEPGMICFDVGANLGEAALHMASRLLSFPAEEGVERGAVYAFEPAPDCFARLQSHTERNGLQTILRASPLALAETTGTATLSVAPAEAEHQGEASLVGLGNRALTQRVKVETSSLDDFVRKHAIQHIDLMSIHVQGAEMKVLNGGARVFTEFSPDLMIGICPDTLKAAGKTSADLCHLIASYGYTIYEMRGGKAGSHIDLSDVDDDFRANVFCSKSGAILNLA